MTEEQIAIFDCFIAFFRALRVECEWLKESELVDIACRLTAIYLSEYYIEDVEEN